VKSKYCFSSVIFPMKPQSGRSSKNICKEQANPELSQHLCTTCTNL
jgi:hypothetical protein